MMRKIWFGLLALSLSFCCMAATNIMTLVRPLDNGSVLKNPGMGWVIYYYANSLKYYAKDIDNIPDEKLFSFPGLAVATFRLSWSALEPVEGVYQWELIDKPAQRFIDKGVKISIRVSNSENVVDQPYATPKWVFDAGAKAHRFRPGYPGVLDELNGANREPAFDDPIFLEKLRVFVKSLAEKYDGKDSVAFVDVGSFGVYGEGHTWSSTKIPYRDDVINQHIDIYREYFKNTLLVANHNFADHRLSRKRNISPIVYAAQHGLALRDDSILIDKGARAYYDQAMATMFFEKTPVILETGEYSSRVKKGYWEPSKIIEAIKAYRASYIGAYWRPDDYLRENSKLIKNVNKIIGYRFALHSVSYPSVIQSNSRLIVDYVLKNTGVARCLKSGNLEFSLYSINGKRMASNLDLSVDVHNIYSKESAEDSYASGRVEIKLGDNVSPGTYWLYAAVVDSEGRAWMEMPHEGKMNDDRRYKIGKVLIQPIDQEKS